MSLPRITTNRLTIILISLFLLFNFIKSETVYINHTCLGQSDNTTDSIAYRANLTYLLNSMSNESAYKSFYHEVSGGISGLFLCRGDIPQSICELCIRKATQELTEKPCPANTSGAIIWYDLCMLRYSDIKFVGIEQAAPRAVYINTTVGTSKTYIDAVFGLIYKLTIKAPHTSLKFDTDDQKVAGGEFQTIMYGLVQCSRDINADNCAKCLEELTLVLPNCCKGRRGWTIMAPSCSMRYEEYLFFRAKPRRFHPLSVTKLGRNQDKESILIRIIVLVSTAVVAASMVSLSIFLLHRRWRARGMQTKYSFFQVQDSSLCELDQGREQGSSREDGDEEVHFFDFITIVNSTNNFSLPNKLGEGGFGPVYKGKLHDGKEIAVKRLSKISKQGLEEFRTEVALIAKLQHKNLVRLLGSCTGKDEKLLIYEYVANKSLDTFLFDDEKNKQLNWSKRANIVYGIAEGVRYLHEESCLKIIHRDLKPSNVLLDEEMNPKISDFGTARIFYGEQIEGKTKRVVGTYGYIAPEYAMKGLFSAKTDVYSFGVLMLEIISGIRNTTTSSFSHPECQKGLLSHVWRLWSQGRGAELIDQNVVDHCPISEVLRWIHMALLCVQEDPACRPTMSSVVLMLGNKSVEMRRPDPPPFSSSSKSVLSGISDTIDRVDH